MKRVFAAVAACMLLLSAAPVWAAPIAPSMIGTIRDLSYLHPNMELSAIGGSNDIVLPLLGVDGTPDFNPLTTSPTVTNAADFHDWFHDTANNQSVGFAIDLIESSPGLYTFGGGDFFPIDNQLLGNEGHSHNYHFTLQASMPFQYAAGQFMNVTADDDLWIFINGALALDLGGTHPPTGASINFDTLGLSAGELYTIDLFFAERHTTQSELSIATNVTAVPEPSTIALGGLASLGAGLCWWRRRK